MMSLLLMLTSSLLAAPVECKTLETMHRAGVDSAYMVELVMNSEVDAATPNNGPSGSILAVPWDQSRFGYKRRMTIETTRIPAADSTEIVALMRFGLINRDTEAAAISYNLTV